MRLRSGALLVVLVACGAPDARSSVEDVHDPAGPRGSSSAPSPATPAPSTDASARADSPAAPDPPDLDALLSEPHPTFDRPTPPIVQGEVLGAVVRAASCEPFVSMDGPSSTAAMRCACRSLCRERFSSSSAAVAVTVPGSGLALSIDPSGEVERCRFEPDDTVVDCDAAEPNVVGASVESPVDPAPARRRLRAGINLEGLARSVMHEHGGKPAVVTHGDLELRLDVPVTLEVRAAWVLRRHCRSTAWESAKPGKHLTLALNGKAVPAGRLALPPGDHVLAVGFDGIDVYQGCDHFGLRYRIAGPDGELEIEAPLRVTRVEPYHPR